MSFPNPNYEHRSSAYPYFSTLSGYCDNTFGFMKFNPPLSKSLPYPYARGQEAPIKYQFDYESLSYPSTSESSNLNCNYASIQNGYRK
jgi:hypothetical protein